MNDWIVIGIVLAGLYLALRRPHVAVQIPGDAATEQAIALALQKLASDLGIAPSDITVTRAERQSWPDASLGCAPPGTLVAQVVTRGWRILLKAQGRAWEYRVREDLAVVLRCSSG